MSDYSTLPTSSLVTVHPYAYLSDRADAVSIDLLIAGFGFAVLGVALLARVSGMSIIVRPFRERLPGDATDTPLWR